MVEEILVLFFSIIGRRLGFRLLLIVISIGLFLVFTEFEEVSL